MLLKRQRLPVEKITAAIAAIEGDLVSAEDEAGERVSRIGHASHVAPGVCGISGMNPDRIAMNAADRFSCDFVAGCTTHVPQDELVRSQRYCFAKRGRGDA